MQLSGFDGAAFLRDDWQKRPALFRAAWADWSNPLPPDELAGLACEDEIESRLVVRAGEDWQVEHGPFPPERFAGLDRPGWSLLVNAVDHHVPAVAALLACFRFIPNWRIDDVMVSYAADGGGVGPHFDQYDVFLIQGLGRRQWQVGPMCNAATPLAPHDDLRLLAQFEANEEWVLEPGDMLYLPPGIAHNGTALGDDCMTYSIGFRAPARSELIAHWCDHVLAGLSEDDRYGDPELKLQENAGEIAPSALSRLQAMIVDRLGDPEAFARWFGTYTTVPKYPDTDWSPAEPLTMADVKAAFRDGLPLCRNPASRFAFVPVAPGKVQLFIDGRCHDCSGAAADFAMAICGQDRFEAASLPADDKTVTRLILELCNRGSLEFGDDTGG